MAESTDGRFARLLVEHGAALRRLAAAYEADVDERDDLIQEISFAIWRALPAFRGDCSERTFVFRIAHNNAIFSTASLQSRHPSTTRPWRYATTPSLTWNRSIVASSRPYRLITSSMISRSPSHGYPKTTSNSSKL